MAFPAGIVGTTAENLLAAANGEHEEWSAVYPGFAAVAREEGFQAIAIAFEKISVAEKQHERRYRGLLENIQSGRVFKRSQKREVAVSELRLRPRRPRSPRRLSGLRPSPGILRDAGGELVKGAEMPGTNQAWRCTVCGYVHHGPNRRRGVRFAGAPRELFEPQPDKHPADGTGCSANRGGVPGRCKMAACIGGGLLGLETAGGLARQGADVTLLEGHGGLLPRGLLRVVVEMLICRR